MIYRNDKVHKVNVGSILVDGVAVKPIRRTPMGEQDSVHTFKRPDGAMPSFRYNADGSKTKLTGGRGYSMKASTNIIEADENQNVELAVYRYCKEVPSKDKYGNYLYNPTHIEIPESGILTVDFKTDPDLYWFLMNSNVLKGGPNQDDKKVPVLVYHNPIIEEEKLKEGREAKMSYYRLISSLSDEQAQSALLKLMDKQVNTPSSVAKQMIDSMWSAAQDLSRLKEIVSAMEESLGEPELAPPIKSSSSQMMSNQSEVAQVIDIANTLEAAMAQSVVYKEGKKFFFKASASAPSVDLGGVPPGTPSEQEMQALAAKIIGSKDLMKLYSAIDQVVERQLS